jgi:hypothetical protein
MFESPTTSLNPVRSEKFVQKTPLLLLLLPLLSLGCDVLVCSLTYTVATTFLAYFSCSLSHKATKGG